VGRADLSNLAVRELGQAAWFADRIILSGTSTAQQMGAIAPGRKN